jgi:cellulose synthase/poly-beta-1,6-N-acetylglucosamine synthase-like glycosyltransferase
MSKNFKNPLAFLHNVQPGEQIEQDEFNLTPGAYPTNGNGSLHGAYPTNGNGSLHGAYPTNGNGSLQFKSPIIPFPNVPETSISSTPTTRTPAMPVTPLPGPPPANIDSRRTQERVKYFADWLEKQSRYEVLNDNSKEINDYIEEATKTVKVGKKEVAIFAPFRPKLSALQTFTTSQVVALCVIGLLWILGLLVFRLEMLTAVIAAITVMYTFNLILSMGMAIRTFRNTPEERISNDIVHALKDVEWPLYTILCPLYREAQVVPQFVQAMLALDYSPEKLQILFLTEEDDVETRNAIRALSLPRHFKILVVPDGKPRTKPRACNYGLMHAKGPYVVIYDAEDIPDPLQLKKAVLTFASHGTDVVCVQAKLNFYNIRQNLLTRWFTAEYSAWFDLILPGLQLAKFSLPLGGTSNHFRAATLRALGGWDAYNVTEDCDLGLRLKRYRMNTVILDSTTLEEANSQTKNWIRQRSRWIKGYMQTYLVHMRNPLEDIQKGRLYDLLSFQFVIGSGMGVMFINPLMWMLLGIYIIFGPSVINVYHILFPGPILYLSTFCLIFGNFFYIYLYLLACMKRRLYHLLPWTLLIPCYWLLMSIAAFYALFELLVKPHYWQKTVHGLHLKGKHASSVAAQGVAIPSTVDEPTMPVPVMLRKVKTIGRIPSITMSLRAMPTLLIPAISLKFNQAQHKTKRAKVRDLWLVAAIVTTCIASISACAFYYQNRQILIYGDAHSHLGIARRLFDSSNPLDITQLGAVWLPLPHMLMWPFIWNDFLWRSGLAGSFVSMGCFLIASYYLYRSAYRLTRSGIASFLGMLAFTLNPDVLYIQATPLSEMVCAATFTAACYYFLCWAQEGRVKFLVFSALMTFLATLTRYDGWAIFAVLLCLVVIIGCQKGYSRSKTIGLVIIYGALAGFGIFLWLLWGQVFFGNALYFSHGIYSSATQQLAFLRLGRLYTYHNLLLSIKYYGADVIETLGPLIAILAVLGLLSLLGKRRLSPEGLVGLAFLTPFAFYVVSLYAGQAIIYVPGIVPGNAISQVFNVRYGIAMAAPGGILIAVILGTKVLPGKYPRGLASLGRVAVLLLIVVQVFLTARGGNIALQDGQYGISCEVPLAANVFLAQYYNGGKVLEDNFASRIDGGDAGFDFRDVIYEGSGNLWDQALANPSMYVTWIVAYPANPVDLVSQRITLHSETFLSQFTLVATDKTGVSLYHRDSDPLVKVKNVPPGFLSQYALCAPH